MEITLTLKTSLSIGGYLSSLFFDKATARDGKGLPLIPASAIKGALRIEFVRLSSSRTCKSPKPEEMCEEPNLCLACRIFGNPASEGKLRFSNARLTGEGLEVFKTYPSLAYEGRYGVTISRRLRTAKEKRLFIEEVLKYFPEGLVFKANIDGFEKLDEEEKEQFVSLLEFLKKVGISIGGRKTVGYGRFAFDYSLQEGESKPIQRNIPASNSCVVVFKPLEPFRVSHIKAREYFLPSLSYIPAPTAKGALAFRAREFLTSDEFKSLFLSTHSFFTPLYPSSGRAPAFPIPLSARTCKACKGFGIQLAGEKPSHGVQDILLETFLISKLAEDGILLPKEEKCPYCGSSLVPIEGYFRDEATPVKVEPSLRITTKLAVNRKTLTSEEGMLYSYALVDPSLEEEETTFVGMIFSKDGNSLGKLGNIREVYVGGGRSRGMGKMEVSIHPLNLSDDIEERCRRLKDALERKAEEICSDLGLEGEKFKEKLSQRFYFSLTLLSPLVLPSDMDLEEYLGSQLKEEVKLECAFAKLTYLGGFNEATKMRKWLMPAISQGSCFLFSTSKVALEEMERLEREGMGLYRFTGCGWVRFCLPFHYELLEPK
jgi:CRISPR-associated protein Csx10